MQLKITGGTYKGKRLKTNKNAQLRPTTEKTRQQKQDRNKKQRQWSGNKRKAS